MRTFSILAKVIYPKYSKYWPYTVAHTIDLVWITLASMLKVRNCMLSRWIWRDLYLNKIFTMLSRISLLDRYLSIMPFFANISDACNFHKCAINVIRSMFEQDFFPLLPRISLLDRYLSIMIFFAEMSDICSFHIYLQSIWHAVSHKLM